MADTVDVAALNAATEEFVADMLRVAISKLEKLGVGDHPDMTCLAPYRAYLRRYDAALAASGVQEAPPSERRLRLVG